MMTCKVCRHPQRQEIDSMLVAGQPFRIIVEKFGVSMGGIFRHKQKCLPKTLARAAEKNLQGESITDGLMSVLSGALKAETREKPNWRIRLRAALITTKMLKPHQ